MIFPLTWMFIMWNASGILSLYARLFNGRCECMRRLVSNLWTPLLPCIGLMIGDVVKAM